MRPCGHCQYLEDICLGQEQEITRLLAALEALEQGLTQSCSTEIDRLRKKVVSLNQQKLQV